MQSTKVLHVVFSSLFASKIAKEDCAPPGPLGLPGKCCALAQVMAYALQGPSSAYWDPSHETAGS